MKKTLQTIGVINKSVNRFVGEFCRGYGVFGENYLSYEFFGFYVVFAYYGYARVGYVKFNAGTGSFG